MGTHQGEAPGTGEDRPTDRADFAAHMLSGMPGIVYLYDAQAGTSLFQNRALSDLLGYDAEAQHAFGDDEWHALMHPQDVERFWPHRERLRTLAPGESASFDYRLRDADDTWRWVLSHDTCCATPGPLHGLIVGTAVDIDAQKRAEQRLDLVMHEFAHRVNNMYMMVSAIVSATYSAGGDDFMKTVNGRLRALAQGNSVLIGNIAPGKDLPAIVAQTFAPFAPGERLSVEGSDLAISGTVAANLSLVLNELATNAVKYGALSNSDGRIAIHWRRDRAGLTLDWRERGGPPVTTPERKGFGSRLIAESLSGNGGAVALDWHPDGLHATIALPPEALASE